MISFADIKDPLYALTVWQPWAWALFHGKTVENRTWHPPRRFLGQVLAIHASKRYERDGFDAIQDLLDSGHVDAPCPGKGDIALGAIIGVARLVNWLDFAEPPPVLPRPPAHGVCGCAGIDHRDECPYLSPWFCGPVGWVFEEPLEFHEPISCLGHQGIWRVGDDLVEAVCRQVALGPRREVPRGT